MDPRHLASDRRHRGQCVYCCKAYNTRDHVPSKVLLDEPYPDNLPVVESCSDCNASFALDEQYLACLLECVICGRTNPEELGREKVCRMLSEIPALRNRIEASIRGGASEVLLWEPEHERVQNVILKLARGHAAYEMFPKPEQPVGVQYFPLYILTEDERSRFESMHSDSMQLWPEIGSRAFLRAAGKPPDQFQQVGEWVVVQQGRYRFSTLETEGGIQVRIVLSEYLGCCVRWN